MTNHGIRCMRRAFQRPRLHSVAVAGLAGLVALSVGGVLAPKPALAWWRAGVWIPGPPIVVVPRPLVAVAPPVVVVPPPVVYAPAAERCYTQFMSCPMEVARPVGSACYCSGPNGDRYYGSAR